MTANRLKTCECQTQRAEVAVTVQAHAEQGGPGVNGAVKYKDASFVLQAALRTDGSHLEQVASHGP